MGSFLSTQPEIRLVMVGLDNAGKTTILYQAKSGERVSSAPTIGFNVEVLTIANLRFTVWDVGGQGAIRSVWRHYYQGVSGVVFVVDSSDRQRFKEAAKELKTMFEESAGDLGNAHLLVLCNKQDLDGAANVSEIKEALNVSSVRTEGMYYVQPCCGLTGVGINEGFQWLAGKLNTNTSTCTIS